MADIDWTSINEKLPYQRTEEQKTKRRELFNQFDPNGNGYLSLAEVFVFFFTNFFPLYQLTYFIFTKILQVDKGMRDVLQSDELFDCKQVKNFINCTTDIFFREIKLKK